MDEILHLQKEFKSKIDQSDNLHKIEQVKSEAFGKNGKTWGEMNPCTRRIDSRKVYCRRAKFQKSVDGE